MNENVRLSCIWLLVLLFVVMTSLVFKDLVVDAVGYITGTSMDVLVGDVV